MGWKFHTATGIITATAAGGAYMTGSDLLILATGLCLGLYFWGGVAWAFDKLGV